MFAFDLTRSPAGPSRGYKSVLESTVSRGEGHTSLDARKTPLVWMASVRGWGQRERGFLEALRKSRSEHKSHVREEGLTCLARVSLA